MKKNCFNLRLYFRPYSRHLDDNFYFTGKMEDFDKGMIYGYASMLIAFAFVYVGYQQVQSTGFTRTYNLQTRLYDQLFISRSLLLRFMLLPGCLCTTQWHLILWKIHGTRCQQNEECQHESG